MAPTPEATLPTGSATMSPAMAQMGHYAEYLLDQVNGVLGQTVLEIGVGHGQYTRRLRRQGRRVIATDVDAECLDRLRTSFSADNDVIPHAIDLRRRDSIMAVAKYQADSILCLNVLEHIADDAAALGWLRESVAPGATMGLVVPAHQRLYGTMDSQAGHFRRYSRGRLKRALDVGGWQVQRLRYINLVGAAGWWYHNRVRRDAGLDDSRVNSQMRRADRMLPLLARLTDPLCGQLGGLSVVAWARAPGTVPCAE